VQPTCDILPAKFIRINSSLTNRHANVVWDIADEQPNTYYSIERSEDGIQYKEAGKISGTIMPRYYWNDPVPAQQRTYYRVKMITGDAVKYSKVVVVAQEGYELDMHVFNNPFHERILIDFASDKERAVTIQLIDITGRIKLEQKQLLTTGINTVQLNVKDKGAAGLYILQVSYKGKSIQQKLVGN
jgi:hypothetical protein